LMKTKKRDDQELGLIISHAGMVSRSCADCL
jgi:hypothetical protein